MREKTIERYLVEQCKTMGYKCIKLTPPPKGIPDRLIICPQGICMFIELKSPTGSLSVAQIAYREELRGLKHRYEVVASIEDVNKVMQYLSDELWRQK